MGNPQETGFAGSAILDLLISMLGRDKGTRACPAMTESQKGKKSPNTNKQKTKGGFQMHFSFMSLFFLSPCTPDFSFPLPPNEAISSYFLDSAKTERSFFM